MLGASVTNLFEKIVVAIQWVQKEVAACNLTARDRKHMHEAVDGIERRLGDLRVLIDSTDSVTDDALINFIEGDAP